MSYDLRSGMWYFDGGQPEVNLRFTRQYRLLLTPPRALPKVPWGQRERVLSRCLTAHNSHNKSPGTTDARSAYKGITDRKGDRGRADRGNNGSPVIAKQSLLRNLVITRPLVALSMWKKRKEPGRFINFCDYTLEVLDPRSLAAPGQCGSRVCMIKLFANGRAEI